MLSSSPPAPATISSPTSAIAPKPLPSRSLEPKIPRDAVIGLIAFLSTLVMTLIGWLWEKIATDDSQSAPP